MNTLEAIITQAWDEHPSISPDSEGPFSDAIEEAIDLLNTGEARVAEKNNEIWIVNIWLKQAVLLYFRLKEIQVFEGQIKAFDKVPLKFKDWDDSQFKEADIRIAPGSVVRTGSYQARDVVVMPSFVNIGTYIDTGTLIDSYATIGSCAQIGQHCHISSGVVIGGVLEAVQATPVIIEDNCFIGAHANIIEGVIAALGAVIGMGVSLGVSTPIVDRKTNQVTYGRVPANSVIVPGTMPSKSIKSDIQTDCAVIVKKVTAKTREKTSLNDLLRA